MTSHKLPRSITFAVVALGVATLLTFPLSQLAPHTRGLFFIAALMLITVQDGPVFGFVGAVLSAIMMDWFFDQNPHHMDLNIAMLLRSLAFSFFVLFTWKLEKQRNAALVSSQEINQSLQQAMDEIRTLRGILPICMHCKQIRDEDGAWHALEKYIKENTHADFTHGVCPSCYKEHYPEIYAAKHSQESTCSH